MENALIIFVRNPEKGKVKSRLAKDIGDDKALEVYHFLLQYTKDLSCACHCSRFVFYSSYIHVNDVFDDGVFTKFLQEGDDLGTRMMNAFKKVFDLGCKKICIIGSDCFELQPEMISEAFDRLDTNDVVAGPARDGGYYLLGMKQLHHDLFTAKEWGTSTVFDDTMQSVTKLGLSCAELAVLNDIDTIDDLLETSILTYLEEEDLEE